MKEVDKIFLTLFKDLKITRNKIHPGTDESPNYMCYIGKNSISNQDVIRLVKKYQDEVISLLLEEK